MKRVRPLKGRPKPAKCWLSKAEADEARRLYREGGIAHSKLAKKYKIDHMAMKRAIDGTTQRYNKVCDEPPVHVPTRPQPKGPSKRELEVIRLMAQAWKDHIQGHEVDVLAKEYDVPEEIMQSWLEKMWEVYHGEG